MQHLGLRYRYKSKFEKKKSKKSYYLVNRSLRRQVHFFHINFLYLKFAFTTSKCTRMHHFEVIFRKFPGGDPPDPNLREGVTPSPTLPLSALRASVKPTASEFGAPAVFNHAPEEKQLDTPAVSWILCLHNNNCRDFCQILVHFYSYLTN